MLGRAEPPRGHNKGMTREDVRNKAEKVRKEWMERMDTMGVRAGERGGWSAYERR